MNETNPNPVETLNLVIDSMKKNSDLPVLEAKVTAEKAALEDTEKALSALLSGPVTEPMTLNFNVSKKLMATLTDTKNLPGISVTDEWKATKMERVMIDDMAESGQLCKKVTHAGNTNYLLITLREGKVESVKITAEKPVEPPKNTEVASANPGEGTQSKLASLLRKYKIVR